jgi:hypothetical protein
MTLAMIIGDYSGDDIGNYSWEQKIFLGLLINPLF